MLKVPHYSLKVTATLSMLPFLVVLLVILEFGNAFVLMQYYPFFKNGQISFAFELSDLDQAGYQAFGISRQNDDEILRKEENREKFVNKLPKMFLFRKSLLD